ncbi:MAG: hypothetical protein JO257_21535 [Deltaproteobacteria bacterium]|nr:hypothetical protein [Deltaproteobacteria bacterium]
MKRIALVLALLVASQRADACPDAAWIPDEVGYGLGLAMLGGYGYGTLYFAGHDLANDRDDQEYVGGDIAFNGLFTAIWATGTVASIEDHSAWALPFAGLTVAHGAMLVHGLEHANVDWSRYHGSAVTWTAGSAYALQALVFLADDDHEHPIVETAINAPLAAGAAFLAYRAHETNDGGHALLYTAAAGISGALAVRGIVAIAHPHHATPLDSLTPTLVDGGVGLATAGSF